MKRSISMLLTCLFVLLLFVGCSEELPTLKGTVTQIEKYGHARLDITAEDFLASGFALGDVVTVSAGSYHGEMPVFNGYYVDQGDYMIRMLSGDEEIALCINYGQFAEAAEVDVGDAVTLTLKEKEGALAVQTLNALVYTDVREDYSSDEIFANFRAVTLGQITPGRLYRSASPANNVHGRAGFANALAEGAGIRSVMNMADTPEELTAHFEAEGFRSDYYKGLHDSGNVIALGLPVNYTSEDFGEGVAKGLTFLAQQEPPYLIHCTEGKDRAGFASMLVSALMGADVEEIVADYMTSYINYYNVEPGMEHYDLIAEKNVMVMLRTICGVEEGGSLEGVDISACARDYLLHHGMDAGAVDALQTKLKG